MLFDDSTVVELCWVPFEDNFEGDSERRGDEVEEYNRINVFFGVFFSFRRFCL